MRQFSTSRRLRLSRDDLVTLLAEENPYLDKMSESVQTQAKDLGDYYWSCTLTLSLDQVDAF